MGGGYIDLYFVGENWENCFDWKYHGFELSLAMMGM